MCLTIHDYNFDNKVNWNFFPFLLYICILHEFWRKNKYDGATLRLNTKLLLLRRTCTCHVFFFRLEICKTQMTSFFLIFLFTGSFSWKMQEAWMPRTWRRGFPKKAIGILQWTKVRIERDRIEIHRRKLKPHEKASKLSLALIIMGFSIHVKLR